jgi:hypothetical protein
MGWTTMDMEAISSYLDNAQLHGRASNDWAEGYWIGRAVEHAHQNAVSHDWLIRELEGRGLDSAVVAIPKPGEPDVALN